MFEETNGEKNNVNVGNDKRFGFFNSDQFTNDAKPGESSYFQFSGSERKYCEMSQNIKNVLKESLFTAWIWIK